MRAVSEYLEICLLCRVPSRRAVTDCCDSMASDGSSPHTSPAPSPPEKPKGISRKKKSASQTEVLERAYAGKVNAHEYRGCIVFFFARHFLLFLFNVARSCFHIYEWLMDSTPIISMNVQIYLWKRSR